MILIKNIVSADEPKYQVGCQSWGYEDWITQPGGDTIFYPRGIKQSEMLPLYSQVFNTIEVDSTAYGIPAASNFEGWYAKTPEDFTFSLKLPKEITHDRNLNAASLPVLNEFCERVTLLKDKLGMLLIQLPARFDGSTENAQNLRQFLSALPKDLRFAIEFRNSDWFIDWTYEEIEKAGVSLALVEGPWIGRETMFAALEKSDPDLAYIRVMGERDLEKFDRVYRHRDEILEKWASHIKRLSARNIFIYVDNHFEGHAPATAGKLQRLLGVPVADPSALEAQRSLF